MKAYVITIMDNIHSKTAAERCIKSGAKYGVDVEMFDAISPKDNPQKMMEERQLPCNRFIDDAQKYSRYQNVISAFLSHFTLWQMAAANNEETMILEHDAVFVNSVPTISYDKVISIGKPSYGKFNTPTTLGVNPLQSKRYFPGAHAYIVKPQGANELLLEASLNAGPTDVFLSLDTFPWLQEYYPWPVEARDTFSTIQKERGCYAKHNYNERYRVL